MHVLPEIFSRASGNTLLVGEHIDHPRQSIVLIDDDTSYQTDSCRYSTVNACESQFELSRASCPLTIVLPSPGHMVYKMLTPKEKKKA